MRHTTYISFLRLVVSSLNEATGGSCRKAQRSFATWLMHNNHSLNDMLFWIELSCREALDPQITYINGVGLSVQNELAHDHPCGRTLHNSVTAKACCDEQILHSRDRSQDRIVVR